MKKRHEYTDLSNVVCAEPGCNRRLKQNLVDKKTNNGEISSDHLQLKCYEHYCEDKGIEPRARKLHREKGTRRIDVDEADRRNRHRLSFQGA